MPLFYLMKLTVLSENKEGSCPGEWGLSYLLELEKPILFDTGATDLFIKNAEKLGVNLSVVDTIVLSHGHFDHGNGLAYLSGQTLIAHPGVFIKRERLEDGSHIGLPINLREANEKFDLILTKEPYWVTKTAVFLGEIPRKIDFESKTTPHKLETGEDDFHLDDSGIAIKTEKGLIVISGCAHAGICNTIEYAKEVTGETKLYAVLGGFHLRRDDSVSEKTIEYLKTQNIEKVIPSHCVCDEVLDKFTQEFGSERIKSGDIIDI